MPKYIIGVLSGIILGWIIFTWYTRPTGVERATWPVAMGDGSKVIVFMTERNIDTFSLPWARRIDFAYRDQIDPGGFVSLPIVLWENEVDDCAKQCQVERSGDKVVIKFPFKKYAGASQYEFTPPVKQPSVTFTAPKKPSPAKPAAIDQ
jgi:hypothetical protein